MSVESIKHKQAIVDEIKDKLSRAESAVIIDYLGTTVEQANAMRRKLRDSHLHFADDYYSVGQGSLAFLVSHGCLLVVCVFDVVDFSFSSPSRSPVFFFAD